MSRDGSGVYTIPNSFTPSTVISSSAMNTNFSDIATAMTGSLPRDGQAGMTGGQIKAADGTVGAPGISWTGDTNCGFRRSGADTVKWVAAGADVATLSATGIDSAGLSVTTVPVATTGANTFTATQTLSSADAGAAAGPDLALYRNSASPAVSDRIGRVRLQGEDSAGNTEDYAQIEAEIVDPVSTSEDARVWLRTVIAGTLADRIAIGAGLYTSGVTGGDPGAGGINAALLQVAGVSVANNIVQTTKTDTFTTSSATHVDVTGMSVAITPRTTAKRVKITVSLSVMGGSDGNGYDIKLLRGSTDIFVGDAAGSRTRTSSGIISAGSVTQISNVAFTFIDSPATISATTYKIQVRSPGADAIFINRTNTDTDASGFIRTASSIIVEEID